MLLSLCETAYAWKGLHVLKPKIRHLQMAEFHQLSVHRWNFCTCIGPKWKISDIFVHLQMAEICLLSLRRSILLPRVI